MAWGVHRDNIFIDQFIANLLLSVPVGEFWKFVKMVEITGTLNFVWHTIVQLCYWVSESQVYLIDISIKFD